MTTLTKVDEIEARICAGGWRAMAFLDCQGYALQLWRSVADPRVTAAKTVPKRGRASVVYQFGDGAVDVAIEAGGPIVENADLRNFDNVRDLARAIAEHDEALEWERAKPDGA